MCGFSQRKCAPQCNERPLKQDANCDSHLYKHVIAAAVSRTGPAAEQSSYKVSEKRQRDVGIRHYFRRRWHNGFVLGSPPSPLWESPLESPAILRKCKYAFLTLPNYSLIAVANALEPLRMANR